MHKLDTNWAARSFFDKKLPRANLSNMINLAWYFAMEITSICLNDRNSIFIFALRVARKY